MIDTFRDTDFKLSDYNFDLPVMNVANYPVQEIRELKLMVINRATGTIEDKTASDIFQYFDEGDVFVKNDSLAAHRYFPKALIGIKGRKKTHVQMLLHREIDPKEGIWEILVHPSRKVRVNQEISFCDGNARALIIDSVMGGMRIIRISDYNQDFFYEELAKKGSAYLPGYIKRYTEPEDSTFYQTTYAKTPGAVNPPSAGFFFSDYLNRMQKVLGIEDVAITRHISLESFSKIEHKFIMNHLPNTEYANVTKDASEKINKAKKDRKQILAIGISSLLTLDDSSNKIGFCTPIDSYYASFIYPNYKGNTATSLLTGFHMPQSQFLVQSANFASLPLMKKAYEHALNNDYKFGAYGDKLLIL